jgi:holo-[acyl-carrier protein] synthase
MATQHFAGRWAAKEAVLKALGTGWRRGISWRDIEITNGTGGRPQATLKGGTQEMADKMGIRCILVSISHCRAHATAFAVALDETPGTFSTDMPWL